MSQVNDVNDFNGFCTHLRWEYWSCLKPRSWRITNTFHSITHNFWSTLIKFTTDMAWLRDVILNFPTVVTCCQAMSSSAMGNPTNNQQNKLWKQYMVINEFRSTSYLIMQRIADWIENRLCGRRDSHDNRDWIHTYSRRGCCHCCLITISNRTLH